MSNIEIIMGLPQQYRRQAAEVYYLGFQTKFNPIMRSQEISVAILEQDFLAEQAIIALYQGEFAAVVGLQYGGQTLTNFQQATFVKHFGRVSGLIRFILVAFLEPPHKPDEVYIDGIVTKESMRSKGIGTALLQQVYNLAKKHNYSKIRLEVVDVNTRARALYERLGFVTTQTRNLAFMKPLMGFSGLITMVKEI